MLLLGTWNSQGQMLPLQRSERGIHCELFLGWSACLPAWQVNRRPLAQDPANTLHLVAADEALLAAAARDPELSRWQLYAATWADDEREASAAAQGRVRSAT